VALVVWAVALVALLVAVRYVDTSTLFPGTLDRIRALGALAPLAFVLLYVLASLAFLPGFPITLGAGAVLGLATGAITVSIGATLGATAAFLTGRYLARDWVTRRIAGHPAFEAIDQAVAREGWKIVGLARLSPAFPFNFLNYAFGLTRVSLRDFFFASWIGMTPGILLYVYIGSLAGDLATATGRQGRGPMEWTFYALGFCATLAVTIYVTRVARKALARRGAP
jgi:uncharacterized membrane protein YdjX (TVP38/TMEM64 family)